jgi:hypothetical protein
MDTVHDLLMRLLMNWSGTDGQDQDLAQIRRDSPTCCFDQDERRRVVESMRDECIWQGQ